MKRFCPLAYLNDLIIDFRLYQFDYLVKNSSALPDWSLKDKKGMPKIPF